jgi:Family of unknown function (DUF6155)
MPKAKLSDFKKLLISFSEQEAKDELLRLFNKLPQVQNFYFQELSSEEDRKKNLEEYKTKIYKLFWTSSGNPKKASGAAVKKLISDFEKVAISPSDVVSLLLYRVDVCLKQANQFGGAAEAKYNTALTAFEKALKIIIKEQLESYFEIECREMVKNKRNMDGWVLQQMNYWMDDYFIK